MTVNFSTPAGLREQCLKTLGWKSNLGLFPVRHHSPTCARHLEAWLRAYKPHHVLIEGPASYNEHIDVLADPDHVAPFALISAVSVDNDLVGRSYYPLCDYSPELVALRVARELSAKSRFIDLAHGLVVAERQAAAELSPDGDDDGPATDDDSDDADDSPADDDEELGSADGRLARSAFTRELVARSGCRDFEEVWESLFEQAGWDQSPEEWASGVLAYAVLSRAGYQPRELDADGTAARERHMAWHIAEVQKGAPKQRIAVITGAFHTAALRDTAAVAPRAPSKAAKSAVSTEVFLAPYTFPRLDALLGYESGMAGPQFYQHVWEGRQKAEPFSHAARQVLVAATRLGRRDGEVLGTADAIAALAFAQQLAHFRGRTRVGRVELIEAATTCLVKGDAQLVGRRLLSALGEVMRGTRVGKLAASAGQSPVVQDFYRRCKELRLTIEHGRPDKKELHIFGSELDLARSRFFSQCAFLELGFCQKERGPDLVSGENLHLTVEHWTVQYVPEVEAQLVTHAHLGATVADVAAALLVKAWLEAEGKSAELTLHLIKGLAMGLHRPTARLVSRLASAMFSDDDVLSLLQAGSHLRTVLRGRERLSADLVAGLPALAQQAFTQGALRLERLAGLSPDRLDDGLAGLASLLDVVLTDAELAPNRELVQSHAQSARELARGKAPAVLGALDGFLLQLGQANLDALARTLHSLTRGRTRTDGAGAYVEGVLAIARQALLGEETLLTALLEHIRDSEWDDFVASLPSLRRAFTRLTPRETEAVATRAASFFGVSKADAAEFLGAPPEVVARLGEWERAFEDGERSWAGTAALGRDAEGGSR